MFAEIAIFLIRFLLLTGASLTPRPLLPFPNINKEHQPLSIDEDYGEGWEEKKFPDKV
jgi:hypothetical protein